MVQIWDSKNSTFFQTGTVFSNTKNVSRSFTRGTHNSSTQEISPKLSQKWAKFAQKSWVAVLTSDVEGWLFEDRFKITDPVFFPLFRLAYTSGIRLNLSTSSSGFIICDKRYRTVEASSGHNPWTKLQNSNE